MLNTDELGIILSDDACYTYKFDVTADCVEEDIIDKNGYNYTAAAGLVSPCGFDEIVERSFDIKHLDMEYTLESTTSELSCAAFLKAYKSGKNRIEATVFYPRRNIYNRLTYFLKKDETTGHIMAYVVCQDVTDTEIYRLANIDTAQRALAENDSIISSAGIGVWKMVFFDGEKPRMYGNDVMMQLLGITDPDMPNERIYEIWHSGIKRSSMPMVERGVLAMKTEGKGEITYSWKHPVLGEIFVRCGGTAQYIENKGYVFRGYHRDVTDIITSEAKQKQLLADALDEAWQQKRMLQEALDNYKQADYDRRTDFLTGLHSRQDMFEMMNDSLSEKRGQVKAVYMMDIDNFKMLNDHYGHSAGDDCLRKIGKALVDYGRKSGICFYRYGGEEVLGVSFSDERNSDMAADDIVKLIYGLNIARSDVDTGRVTVSLGYTTENSHFEYMIDRADKAMYQAKSGGKNRAVCFETM